ncbi:MAG: P-loop NTPase [Chryseobacterium sp.]|uniref:ParA family protein n=1 Tax=Chryseobacterium sp. ERMR1:04 TaxID=1705393 RepID=UPI0006C8BF60|nr:P-loop NTPase [Chryseobacterium sp. ERMR1:04]KPH13328.1 conjugal transfer protein TraA [Chryseobacterium sp. ERMR1:04]MDN5435047.1 P-loop NTPase [Acinetobacter sp.]MDN5477650.1 P-loop NTPase [Chryseobacterium sp.]
MDKKNKTLFIAFASQKGGVGKSTFTAIVASVLHFRMGYNVAVFDCDYPQYSLMQMRERDLQSIMHNEIFKKLAYRQFSTINKKAYPIMQCRADEALSEAERFIESSSITIDIIFFDLPGTVNTSGLLNTLAGIQHIFSPITADRLVMESTLRFTDVMANVLMKKGSTSIETIQLFWNQVDRREKSPLYESYEKVITDLGLHLMDSRITDSKRFRKESEAVAKTIFRSTLLPPDEKLMKSCHLDLFIDEFLRTIKL